MCTVAFLPLDGGGYLLGHNRDESVRRPRGLPPELRREKGRAFLAPRDPEGNGSWIGANDSGVTLCILNAAETDPSRLPASPVSRGLVLWRLLHLDSIEAAEENLDGMRNLLDEVRAFHLVVAARGGRDRHPRGSLPLAGWFRWNGSALTRGVQEGPALFVSSGFDQERAERERGGQWREFLAGLQEGAPAGGRGKDSPARIALVLGRWLASHTPSRGALSVCMHRSDARTVSRTLVVVDGDRAELHYHDGPPCEESAPASRHELPLR